MEIKKRKNNKKQITIVALVMTFIVISGYVGAAAIYKLYPFQETPKLETDKKVNAVNYDKPTKEQEDAPTEITDEGSVNLPDDTKTTGQPTKDVVVGITSSQIDASGSLRIGTVIQAVTNSGKCTLVVEKAGQEAITQTVDIQAMSNSSTCKGFVVLAEKLSSGTYTVTVTYVDGDAKGSDKRDVVVP